MTPVKDYLDNSISSSACDPNPNSICWGAKIPFRALRRDLSRFLTTLSRGLKLITFDRSSNPGVMSAQPLLSIISFIRATFSF